MCDNESGNERIKKVVVQLSIFQTKTLGAIR